MNDITTLASYLAMHRDAEKKKFKDLKDAELFDKAIEYRKIEDQIQTLFGSLRKNYIVIQKEPSNEEYVNNYWDKMDQCETLYKQLKAICDYFSFNAILCPAIYCAEIYEVRK